MDKRKVQKIEAASEKAGVVEERKQDIVDILLDENNKDPIILADNNGRRISFEQIAVIPYKEKLYCVLKPIDKIEGVNDDEAIVFVVVEEEGKEPVLMVEADEQTAIDVFEEYYNLLDEAAGVSGDDGEEGQKPKAAPKAAEKKTSEKKTDAKTAASSSAKSSSASKTTGTKSASTSSAKKSTAPKGTGSKK